MNVEQIASDFITKMNDVDAVESYLTPNALAAGGVLPQPIPAKEAISILSALKTAFPDLKFDVQSVTTKGNQATVQGDKVSRLEVDSPPDGGIPAALGQIGVAVPGM